MNTDIVKIKEGVQAMTADPVVMAGVWAEVMNAKAFIAETEKTMKAYMMDLMRDGDIREIQLGNGVKVYRAEKKKDRFDTATIYAAIGITEEQAKYLPKNPSWRKTAVLANPDTAVAYAEEMSETVEYELKEVDENMLKQLGLIKPKRDKAE